MRIQSTPARRTDFTPGSIHEAASQCDLDAVSELTAFIDDAGEDGIQAIHIAAGLANANVRDQVALVEFLIENGADLNNTDTEDGLSPLHLATESNNPEVVVLLLANGADASQEDLRAETALHLAASYGHTDVVELLVSRCPPCVGLQSSEGNTALHYAAAHGHEDSTSVLLGAGAQPEVSNKLGSTALHYAAGHGYASIVELLLDYHAEPDQAQNDGSTGLHFASTEDHVDVLRVLVDHQANLELCTAKGSSALLCAAERGNVEIVTALCEYGANLNTTQNAGNTPLMYAAAKGHDDVVSALLSEGADLNQVSNSGRTAVHHAVSGGHCSIVGILLSAGANPNHVSNAGETPLFSAAAQGNVDTVTFLLDHGAEANGYADAHGDTPLHLAFARGDSEVLMALVNHGAQLDVVNKAGSSPLDKSSYSAGDEVAIYLSQGECEGRTMLWDLVTEMTEEVHSPDRIVLLRRLIEVLVDWASDVNHVAEGKSVLDAALTPGGSFDYETVQIIVNGGADCSKGLPLNRIVHEVAQCTDPVREDFLLDALDALAMGGGCVDTAEAGQCCMLDVAINAGHARMIHRLVSVGADVKSELVLGKLCLELRRLSEQPHAEDQMIQLLGQSIIIVIEAGADVNAAHGNKQDSDSQEGSRSLSERYSGTSCIEHLLAAGHEAACKALIFHGANLAAHHILNRVVEEMCEIDPADAPPEHAAKSSAATHGAQRMVFLEEVFHSMVAQPGVDLDDEYGGKTVLQRASEDTDDDLPFGQAAVSALLDAGADVNKTTVFFGAVKNLCRLPVKSGPRWEGQMKMIRMLLEQGADVNQSQNDTTPLTLAWNAGNQKLVQLLTDRGGKFGSSTLLNVMKPLIEHQDDVLANQLSQCILRDIVDKYSGKERKAFIDYEEAGMTPLTIGILSRQFELVLGGAGLLAVGVDLNQCAPFNLCLSELKGCKEEDVDFLERIAMYLLEHDVEVNTDTQSGLVQAISARSYIAFAIVQSRKALHNALFSVLKELIATSEADVQDYLERLVIALISANNGIREVCDDETAFSLSMMTSNRAFIELLLQKKCNTRDGQPFHRTLAELPKAGADTDRIEFLNYTLLSLLSCTDAKDINRIHQENTPLTLAIRNDARQFTAHLLQRKDLDLNLGNPLVLALNEVVSLSDAEEGKAVDARLEFLYSLIAHLLDAGVNLVGAGKQSVLIMAIDTGRVDLVKRMVQANIDVNDSCPLAHCLAVFEDPDATEAKCQAMEQMALLLVERGADPNVDVPHPHLAPEPALTVAGRAGLNQLTRLLIRSNTDKNSFDKLDKEGRPALHRFLHWLDETPPEDSERRSCLEKITIDLVECVHAKSLDYVLEDAVESPLDISMRCQCADLTEALLARGASFGPTALIDRLVELNEDGIDQEHYESLETTACYLIEHGAAVNFSVRGQSPFDLVFSAGSIRVLDSMFKHNLELRHAYPFHKALQELPTASGGRTEILRKMLHKLLSCTDAEDVNRSHKLNTPLTLAIRNDAQEFTAQLLQREDLDLNACNPLAVAFSEVNSLGPQADSSRLEFLYYIIGHLLDADVKLSAGSESLLIMAIDTGRVDLVKRMIATNIDVNDSCPLAHCLAVFEDPDATEAKRQAMEQMALLLVERGADPNVEIGADHDSALTVAGRAGLNQLTRLLVTSNTDRDSFDKRDKDGRPALHRFLHWLEDCDPTRDVEKVAFFEMVILDLIRCVSDHSIDVVIDGLSPLDIAMRCDNGTITYALLENGASFGSSALIDRLVELNAPGIKPMHYEFVERTAINLIEKDAAVNIGVGEQTPFGLTFSAGSAKVFAAMLDHGLDVYHGPDGESLAHVICSEVVDSSPSGDRLTFLTAAAVVLSAKDPSMLHELLDSADTSPDAAALAMRLMKEPDIEVDTHRELDGNTPLHCAASAGDLRAIKVILTKGADVNAVDHYNQTPLLFASVAGHLDCVKTMLSAQANPSTAGGQYLRQMTALHEAALGGHSDICEVLLAAGAPVNANAYWKRTALHLAVVAGIAGEDKGRLACVRVLILGGCDVNASDLDNETALSYAVERDYHEVSALLLEHGADPCGADIHGETPLHHCIENHNTKIFQSLLSNRPHDIEVLGLLAPVIRADFKPGIDPLAQPCGEISTSSSMKGMKATAKIGGWAAPLFNACYFGKYDLAEQFLSQVGDINSQDHAGFTLLHRLVHWGGEHHTDFMSALLQKGASPNVRDKSNLTPLQAAVRLGNERAIQVLLQGGATASAEDLKVAKESGDVVEYLDLYTVGNATLPSSSDSPADWCEQHNAKYLDPNFKPCLGSLAENISSSQLSGRYHDVEWRRAGEVAQTFMGSMGGMSAGAMTWYMDGVTVGPIGDPFFIATIPDDPSAAFGNQNKPSAHGVYEVVVDYMGQRHKVVVDDFVPTIDGEPISACSQSGMIWPMIYEKACAKVAGSYQALSALRLGDVKMSEAMVVDESMNASARRQHEVNNFITPCLSAAMLGGFASDEKTLADFAEEFTKASHELDHTKLCGGKSQPMTTVGQFDMQHFSITAYKMITVPKDTIVRAECSFSSSTADSQTVSLCVAEVTSKKWCLVRGNSSTVGQTSVVVEAPLCCGTRYLVFFGTPVTKHAERDPEISLSILCDDEIEFQDA